MDMLKNYEQDLNNYILHMPYEDAAESRELWLAIKLRTFKDFRKQSVQ